mgnify:CR=1 FL=1
MLFRMLKKIKAGKGFDAAMREKIDVLFLSGSLTAEEYRELLDLPEEDAADTTDDNDGDTADSKEDADK